MNKKILRGIIAFLVIVLFTSIGVFIGTKLDFTSTTSETPDVSTDPDPVTSTTSETPDVSTDPDPVTSTTSETPDVSTTTSETPDVSTDPDPVTSTPEPTFEPFEDPTITAELTTEPVYGFKQQEIFLMAQLLCGDKNRDGDGEYDIDFGNDDRYDQISLVLCVVMNRVNDERFPNTIEDVIWQNNGTTYQFSVMKQWGDDFNKVCQPSDIAIQRVTEWCEAYDRGDPSAQSIPTDHVMFVGNGNENISSTTK